MENKAYLAIDLKSFYDSVACIERGLDPMTTNLVVADLSRTEKTICLAVSPALKSFGVPGRPRLFEVVEKLREVNALRASKSPDGQLHGSSHSLPALTEDPSLAVDYLVAPPQRALYIQRSTEIYNIYLQFVSPEDIHVYSVDEVFIDVTPYLHTYGLTAREMAEKILREVAVRTGITATVGIGSNLFLCKAAMDILAKHAPPDENGARIAELTEESYRRTLWDHRPLTDFWRVGWGYQKKLAAHGIYTMGDIARCSMGAPGSYYSEDLLYSLFGVNAELLIDHAWGWEPCTIADIKAYRPESRSLGAGQVLQRPYPNPQARLIVQEMADQLALSLVEKGLAAESLVLTLGYDRENLSDPGLRRRYKGETTLDPYGRAIPRHAHGSVRFPHPTASSRTIVEEALRLFDRIAGKGLLVRRVNLTAGGVVPESPLPPPELPTGQLDLFTDYTARFRQEEEAWRQANRAREKERRMQQALLQIQKKYGKNAVLKGMNLLEGATARERNGQIGGHKA